MGGGSYLGGSKHHYIDLGEQFPNLSHFHFHHNVCTALDHHGHHNTNHQAAASMVDIRSPQVPKKR